MNILIVLAVFAGGWFTGHETSTTVCVDGPLVVAECVEIFPPQDETFGATTSAYIGLVGQYRKCKQACLGGEGK